MFQDWGVDVGCEDVGWEDGVLTSVTSGAGDELPPPPPQPLRKINDKKIIIEWFITKLLFKYIFFVLI